MRAAHLFYEVNESFGNRKLNGYNNKDEMILEKIQKFFFVFDKND